MSDDNSLLIRRAADVVPETRRGGEIRTLLSPRSVGATAGFMGVATIAPGKCAELSDAFYHPERPACRPRASLFVGVVGPAITALQVGGIGANGRLAEARQAHAVRALRVSMGGVAAPTKVAPVRVIDLLPNGTRFPLGWHLSPLAVGGIETQARNCELAGIAATAASAR